MKAGRVRITLAALVTAAVTLGLGALSQVPYEADTADHAILRIAWRARSVRVEECRRLTPEELEEIPTHMRQEEVCEGRMIPYDLTVLLDGEVIVNEVVRAAGAREDRPLYVSHEVPVAVGEHDLIVRFVRQGDVPPDSVSTSATPSELVLERRIDVQAKDVALVTYDAAARQLVVVAADRSGGVEGR